MSGAKTADHPLGKGLVSGKANLAEAAKRLILQCSQQDLSLATCESLTGGGVGEVLTSVSGASAVYRGGLITYSSELKSSLAGVDAAYIEAHGVINEVTAVSMARGCAERCGADLGLATTGVAGPDPQDGHQPGDVWIAVHHRQSRKAWTDHLDLAGERGDIRDYTVYHILRLALDVVMGELSEGRD